MTNQRLEPGAETVHWGWFDATLDPVLTVDSGDTVTIATVSGGPEVLPAPSFDIPDALKAVHAHVPQRLPGHMCTGPVAVRGARAGDVLQVDIRSIELHYDWGYTYVQPLKGALPDDFEERRLFHVPLDREKGIGRTPWGMDIPLAPFFGVMAVAPPPAWGRISTLPPRRNGGNLDNKELVAGTTLYLPIHVDGARFSVGDGHGAQGDGEVCVTAIETGLIGTFDLTVRQDLNLVWPLAETPGHMITMAFDPDLDTAAQIALRQMIDLIVARAGIDRYEAFALCSLVGDLRVTQVVNGNKGIHMMLEKRYLEKP
ncbi:acetamidase/formamidase family protein [Fodinicurvata sp. EGI_FJ10296]|uniref:acetamidase/formamidase family protein n=1 Tax=Fodinicurvata sp. EGI_FJ10296 TaxID=3231908 RepID=UPI0034536D9B